jgi:hypothetical protein
VLRQALWRRRRDQGRGLGIAGICRVADCVGKVFDHGSGRAGKRVVVNAEWEGERDERRCCGVDIVACVCMLLRAGGIYIYIWSCYACAIVVYRCSASVMASIPPRMLARQREGNSKPTWCPSSLYVGRTALHGIVFARSCLSCVPCSICMSFISVSLHPASARRWVCALPVGSGRA